MAGLSKRLRVGATSLLAALAVVSVGGRAEAQYAPGFGLNGSAYPFYTPGFGPSRETQYLFGRSESLSEHHESLLREHYRNNVANPRDFKQSSREDPGQSTRRRRPRPPAETSPGSSSTAAPRPSTPSPLPEVELGSFLGPDGHVDWPLDVPRTPDLDARRVAADDAIRSAAARIKDGRLTVQAVDLARERLIAFGQPSLARVRAERSPRVAESFHTYLRQLLQAIEHATPVTAGDAGAVAALPADG